MIPALPLFHRIAGTKVVVVAEGAMGEAKQRLVERAGGIPVSEAEAAHARLAFIAIENEREAEKVAMRLKRLGLLVNVADRPDLCDFTTPSILDRAPVVVAIGTDGASAGLAKQIRLRLERIVPANLGTLATKLAEAREAMRAKWPEARTRRQALDAAFVEGGACDPFDAASADRVDRWLSDDFGKAAPEMVAIDLRSRDPEDLTLREARLLGQADVIWHDMSVPDAILDRARADAERRVLNGDLAEAGPGETVVTLRFAQAASATRVTSAK